MTKIWQSWACMSLIVGGLVMVYGLTSHPSGSDPYRAGYGVGGPAEPPLSAQDGYGPSEPDSLITANRVQPEGQEIRIGRDQSFYAALASYEAPHNDIMTLVKACKPLRDLKKVRRGDVFHLVQDPDGGIRQLSFDLDIESYLVFEREGDGYQVLERTYPVEYRLTALSGTIRSSLYESLQTIGAPLSLASKMNDILGWEIDFHRDLRENDTFRIVYEEIWKEGEFVRTGHILTAECVNRSRQYRAFRFCNQEGRPGYYNAEGNNLQKQLLRAPLEYSRISSGFAWRRLHPILKRYMPHLGIDYAAPVGTPVWAAGDGQVVEMSRKKGNGRYLKIRHTNGSYESYYLHLSRYARGIKKGVMVKQRDVIGYVGASGYATGPHLDFRIKKDGSFVDPRRVKLPPANPVPDESLVAFMALTERYNRTLDRLPEQSTPVAIHLARPAPVVTLWDAHPTSTDKTSPDPVPAGP